MSNETVTALGNKYSAEILEALTSPKTAQELSTELDVPIATCYRRIEDLQDVNLVEQHDKRLTEERRRVATYRRCINALTVTFEGESISVTTTEESSATQSLDEAWREISSSSSS